MRDTPTFLLNDKIEEKAISQGEQSHGYFCSWEVQNLVLKLDVKNFPLKSTAVSKSGETGATFAVNMLDEDLMFGEGGYAHQYPQERNHLYFMLDYGWDIDYITDPDLNMRFFGGHVLNENRFPSFTGSPAERLKKLNAKIREMGWKGLGIWVPSQPAGICEEKPFPPELIDYWRERILWSKYAEIPYWKVDLGSFAHDVQFRKMLTELGEELYPELLIEHTICSVAVNGEIEQDGRFVGCENEPLFRQTYAFSQVFRSSDVSVELGNISTLDRLGVLLQAPKGLINSEDTPFLAASLGLSVGIMRSSYETTLGKSIDFQKEITALINWQRFAPAFGDGTAQVSEDILASQYQYGETWVPNASNKTVTQQAPSCISRNTPMPTVSNAMQSNHVTASQNPSGAYTVAAIPRPTVKGDMPVAPTAICYPQCGTELIGIFGEFESICFDFGVNSPVPCQIIAQNLICGTARDLTNELSFQEGKLTLDRVCLASFAGTEDPTKSAMVLRLLYNNEA